MQAFQVVIAEVSAFGGIICLAHTLHKLLFSCLAHRWKASGLSIQHGLLNPMASMQDEAGGMMQQESTSEKSIQNG